MRYWKQVFRPDGAPDVPFDRLVPASQWDGASELFCDFNDRAVDGSYGVLLDDVGVPVASGQRVVLCDDEGGRYRGTFIDMTGDRVGRVFMHGRL